VSVADAKAMIKNNEEQRDLMSNWNEESVDTLAFEPERLRLARELKEWSQAELATRLDVTPAAVSQFETGVTRPGMDALDRMTSALGVPAQFFSLPVTETHDGFFRSLRRTSVSHRRRARALAHIAHDLAVTARAPGLPPVRVPHIPVTGLHAPREELEEAARQVRQAFGMPSGPVPNVAEVLEKHGILVIRLPLDTADVDAFSLPFHDRPVVVLGTDKNDRARSRFDGAHELGHLVVHGDQIWGVKEVERQADSFAAAFLMPAEDIRDELPDRADWPVLFQLKKKWQVSLAALLMRARTLGRMSENNYLTAVKAASARGWRRVEPRPLGKPEHPTCLKQLLATPAGRQSLNLLPHDVVDALVIATAT
jgi:Zn-dependent peptidase ImmA (M78 family)/transcriptional regulator with XRE-family HTH domain